MSEWNYSWKKIEIAIRHFGNENIDSLYAKMRIQYTKQFFYAAQLVDFYSLTLFIGIWLGFNQADLTFQWF